jgi:hypothetical protein
MVHYKIDGRINFEDGPDGVTRHHVTLDEWSIMTDTSSQD